MLFQKENYKDRKAIIIFFSRADENYSVGYIEKGNTEVLAEYIKDITNADMFKVEPSNPYSVQYDICTKEAKQRQENHIAPIKKSIPDLSDYELIYIGSPVYWGKMPEELVTALKDIDYTDKKIRPFVTHEGSGLAQIPNQVEQVCKGATVLDSLVIRGTLAKSSRDKVEEWI